MSPTAGLKSRTLFVLCNVLYYGIGRHLPYSVRPYAFGARRIRYELCRHMFASCGTNVNVEHGALINSGRAIHIGNNSGIGLDAYVSGPLMIGDNVVTGPNCTFLAIPRNTRRADVPMIEQGFKAPMAPILEDDVWLGANVTVLPGRRIGRGSIVRSGAVVTADVPPYAVVVGNPAKIVEYRTEPVAHHAG